jgi:hypothetical protein
LTGADLNPKLVETGTLIVFLLSFALSILLNIKDRSSKR